VRVAHRKAAYKLGSPIIASVSNDPEVSASSIFDRRNERRTLRFGKVSKADAAAVAWNVSAIVAAQIAGQHFGKEQAEWLASIGDALDGKLARPGLVEPRGGGLPGARLAQHHCLGTSWRLAHAQRIVFPAVAES
jgi:hypothetical protein